MADKILAIADRIMVIFLAICPPFRRSMEEADEKDKDRDEFHTGVRPK